MNPVQQQKINKNLLQAITLQKSGKCAEAERKYRSILKKQPLHTDALQFLGIMLHQNGKSASALHLMQLAHKSAPKNIKILINLAEIYKARADVENTLFFAQQVLNLQARNPDALAIMGAVYCQINRLHESLDFFSTAIDIKPDDENVRNQYADVCCTLGQAQEQQGDTDNAFAYYCQALEKQPTHIASLISAGRLSLAHQPDLAEKYFSRVLKLQANHIDGLYWSGIQARTMGNFSRATRFFLQVIGLQPSYSKAWYSLSFTRDFIPDSQQINELKKQYELSLTDHKKSEDSIAFSFALAHFLDQKRAQANKV